MHRSVLLGYPRVCRTKACEGFYVVDSPGVAETLDMRDEGETLGLLPRKTGVSTWSCMLSKKKQ